MEEKFLEKTPWWGGDLQTVRNAMVAEEIVLPGRSTRLSFLTSDGSGDCLVGSLEEPNSTGSHGPLIVLIHGLTGCEDSSYIRRTAQFHLMRGRRVLRLNLRGAGPEHKRTKGYYHGGCASDVQDVLAHIAGQRLAKATFVIGYSLGGNILLNLLAELNSNSTLVGAAAVSAPIEPAAACRQLMKTRNALYHRWLLRRMKAEVITVATLSDEERRAIENAQTVFEFDDRWVAPRNGFKDAQDYYQQTASHRKFESIRVPTLLLHARNDPWIPAEPYYRAAYPASGSVEAIVAESGGHVGFHERGQRETWHDRKIETFLKKKI